MNFFALFDFLGIVFILYLGSFVYFKAPSDKLNRIFFINAIAVAYTAAFEYLRLTSATLQWAFIWHKFSFLWPFLPVLFLKFALTLTKNKYGSGKRINYILFAPPVVISFLHLFTNSFYTGMVYNWYGWEASEIINFFSICIIIYFVVTAVLSILLMLGFYLRQKTKEEKNRSLFALIGLSIPIIAAYFKHGIMMFTGIKLPPLESLSSIIGMVFLSVSILKYKFFIPDPIETIKTMFATASDYLVIFQEDGIIVLVSQSFLDYGNFEEHEVIGASINKFFFDYDLPASVKMLHSVGSEFEIFMRTKSGDKAPVSAVTSSIKDSIKSPVIHFNTGGKRLYLLIGRNIRERKHFEEELVVLHQRLEQKVKERTEELSKTNSELRNEILERKKVEYALRESEERFRNLFENSPIGIYRTAPDGRILLANPAILKMLGHSSFEELAERNLEEEENTEHDYIRQEFKNKIEKNGEIIGFESRWTKKDGTKIFVRENAKCIYDDKGEVQFYEGTVEDITAQVNASAALRESEERFRNLVENINEIFFISDPLGRVVYASPNLYNFTGFLVKDWIGCKVLSFVHKDDLSRVLKFYIENRNSGTLDASIEFRSPKKDGTVLWVEQITRFVRDEKGNILEYRSVTRDVTHRKTAEKLLIESEEKYRNLVESINEVYYITDKDGKTAYISPNVISFSGYPAEFFIGKSSFILTYKEDFKRIFKFYQDRVNDGTIDASAEFRAVKKDGTIYWVEQITRIIRDEKGRAVEFRNVARDITQRKMTEEMVQLLAQAIKSTGEGISITDLNNNLIYVNESFNKIYGYEEEELIGENISIVRSENNPDPLIEEIRKATVSGGWSGEVINKKKDGTEFPIFLSTSSVFDDNGKPYALVGVSRDITERKLAERQLEEYKNHLELLVEERTKKIDNINKLLKEENKKLRNAEASIQDQLSFLQTLIDTIPNPIFFRDTNKLYIGCNKAFEAFHGVTRKELIGKNVYYLSSIIESDYVDNRDDELLKTHKTQNYETFATDKDNNKYDVIVYKAVFYKSDGTVGGIVGLLTDITEVKKLEVEIRNSLEKEKELSELKSRFISVASHEFRTPLTSILASADLLELYGRKWPESKYYDYVGNIQRAVEYMTELINDVLTVSRADTGKIYFNPSSVNLFEHINNIFENAKLSAPSAIKFSFKYDIEEKIFNLDSKLITQILSNLLSNAVKYSPDGGEIELTVNKKENCLSLSVSDQGMGIPDEDQALLFEPFHRGNNVGTISGTGLGLSIVKKSVDIHHGKIFVESKLNKGTKITVQLNDDNSVDPDR